MPAAFWSWAEAKYVSLWMFVGPKDRNAPHTLGRRIYDWIHVQWSAALQH